MRETPADTGPGLCALRSSIQNSLCRPSRMSRACRSNFAYDPTWNHADRCRCARMNCNVSTRTLTATNNSAKIMASCFRCNNDLSADSFDCASCKSCLSCQLLIRIEHSLSIVFPRVFSLGNFPRFRTELLSQRFRLNQLHDRRSQLLTFPGSTSNAVS